MDTDRYRRALDRILDQIFKSFVGPGTVLILIATIFFLIFAIARAYTKTLRGESILLDWLLDEAQEQEAKIVTLSFVAAFVGVVINTLPELFRKIWEESVAKTFQDGFHSISTTIVDNLRPIKNTFSAHKVDQLLATAGEEELNILMPRVIAKLYGPHCCNPESFFDAVQTNFSRYYDARMAYRTMCQKNINVMDHGTNLRWHEVCHYSIHCIALDSKYEGRKPEKLTYPVRFYSKAMVEPIKTKDDLKFDVKVKVDNHLEFDLMNYIDIVDASIASNDANLKLKYDGQNIEIAYEKNIELQKEWTKIETLENSVLSKNDSWYSWRTRGPMHGLLVNFNLPPGYRFTELLFTDQSIWSVNNNPSNVVVAKTDSWVYPGAVFHFRWDAT